MNRVDAGTIAACALVAAARWLEPIVDGTATSTSTPTSASTPTSTPTPTPTATASCSERSRRIPVASLPDPPIPSIEQASSLAPFFARLAALSRGRAKDHVRIAVYGDSNGTRDYLTGEMRRVLQRAYGDGGHGFVTMGRPWRWHSVMDIRHDTTTETWGSFAVTSHPAPDRFHGHGLIAAYSMQTGATTWLATAGDDAPIGRTASRFDVHYLKQAKGGPFEIRIDGAAHAVVDTAGSPASAGFAEVRVPDAPHKIEIVAQSWRQVRILGVTVERDDPSVIVDGIGVGMLNCEWLLRDDPALYAATLARRKYDLVVFHLGTLSRPQDFAPCMEKLFQRHRAALPDAALLVMSPPDFLEDRFHPPRPAPWVAEVRDAQRRFAREQNVAFWDFFEAMGGSGSMFRFEHEAMTIKDGVHFSEKGGAYMGDRVVAAIAGEYEAWMRDNPHAGCE